MSNDSSRASMLVGMGLVLLLAAAEAVARNAPSPLPAYGSLTRNSNLVLHSVSDEVGKFWMIGSHEYYIWDMALARLPNGQVWFLRLELQRDDGEYYIYAGQLSNWAGAEAVSSLEAANANDWVEIADENGRLDFVHSYAIGAGAIGSDGTTIVDIGAIDRGGCKGKNVPQCNGNCGPLLSCSGTAPFCFCSPTDPITCGGTRSIECENASCSGQCGGFCHCS